jgi:hypothetical protein
MVHGDGNRNRYLKESLVVLGSRPLSVPLMPEEMAAAHTLF